MASEKAEFYFEAVRRYRRQGEESHRAGNNKLAAQYFIEAARNLLRLAECCDPKLQAIQIEKARELRELAARLAEEPDRKNQRAKPPGAGGTVPEDPSEQPEACPWTLDQRPNVSFDDIVGLDDVKQRIERFIIKFRHPEETAKWPGARLGDRLILYGPPGTGKTMFAKAIAHEIAAAFFLVKGSNLLDKWVGESQKNVKRLFDQVRRAAPAVVFLDEIDGILAKRGSSSTVRDGVVSEFIQEMEGLSSPNNAVLFVGATNLPTALDQAVVSRFGAMFYIPLPDPPARLALLQREFARFPYGFAPDIDLDALAQRLEGHSMRSISILTAVLNDMGIQASAGGQRHAISRADVDAAMQELPQPLSAADLTRYRKFGET